MSDIYELFKTSIIAKLAFARKDLEIDSNGWGKERNQGWVDALSWVVDMIDQKERLEKFT